MQEVEERERKIVSAGSGREKESECKKREGGREKEREHSLGRTERINTARAQTNFSSGIFHVIRPLVHYVRISESDRLIPTRHKIPLRYFQILRYELVTFKYFSVESQSLSPDNFLRSSSRSKGQVKFVVVIDVFVVVNVG